MTANYFGHNWFSLRFWRRKNLGTWQYVCWWSYRKHSSHGLSLILFAGWRALSIHRWVLTHRPSRKYHALSLWTYFNALFNNHKPRPPLASLGPLTAGGNIGEGSHSQNEFKEEETFCRDIKITDALKRYQFTSPPFYNYLRWGWCLCKSTNYWLWLLDKSISETFLLQRQK